MIDEAWIENVGDLIGFLLSMGMDPIEWTSSTDLTFLDQAEPWKREHAEFACGYMQATGNLTGRTWAEQMEDHRKEWDERE